MSSMNGREKLLQSLPRSILGGETEKLTEKNQRALKMLESLSELRREGVQCDFKVRIDGNEFPVHRSVLAASSNYFKAMLKNDMKESKQGYVEIKGLKGSAVKACLDYLYSGEVDLCVSDIEPILKASDMMQIDDLQGMLFEHILKNISVDNCLILRHFAMTYHSEKTLYGSEHFIANNFADVAKTEQIKYSTKTELLRYMELFKDSLPSPSIGTSENPQSADICGTIFPEYLEYDLFENRLQWAITRKAERKSIAERSRARSKAIFSTQWQAIVSWVNFNRKERADHLLDLLKNITVFDISAILSDVILHPLILSRQDCEEFLVTKIILPNLAKISKYVNLINSFILKQWAKRYNSNELRKIALEPMIKNFQALVNYERITELDLDDIKALLLEDRTSQFGEQSRYNAIVKWIRGKENERLQHFENLFSFLDLNKMSVDFIHSQIRNEPIVKSCPACNEKIMDALYAHAKRWIPTETDWT